MWRLALHLEQWTVSKGFSVGNLHFRVTLAAVWKLIFDWGGNK